MPEDDDEMEIIRLYDVKTEQPHQQNTNQRANKPTLPNYCRPTKSTLAKQKTIPVRNITASDCHPDEVMTIDVMDRSDDFSFHITNDPAISKAVNAKLAKPVKVKPVKVKSVKTKPAAKNGMCARS